MIRTVTAPQLFAAALGVAYPDGPHHCFFCGAPCDEAIRRERRLSNAFTGWAEVTAPTSEFMCAGCFAVTDESDRSKRPRFFSWVVTPAAARLAVLNTAKRAAVIRALVEGNSINSTVRMTGVSKPTILTLIERLGVRCQAFHDTYVVGLETKHLQCDEIWAFVHSKKVNTAPEKRDQLGHGDIWTWTALDQDSKLMVHWHISPERQGIDANAFMRGVAPRMLGRIQITTDGHRTYKNAVGNCFDVEVNSDYAQVVKTYGDVSGDGKYSPGHVTGIEIKVCWGDPDPKHITTSHVERANLTMRMGMRRYTRLTNGFSKKVANHQLMTTIFFTYYNWCRVHQTLKMTPAMKAGLTNRRYTVEELAALLDD